MDMAGMEQRLSDIRGITLKSLLENPTFLQPPTNNNEGKDGKKDKEAGFLDGFDNVADDMAAAFLGPALWDKTPYDDLKLEYMDLDEFLSENGITFSSQEGKDAGNATAEQDETPDSGVPVSPTSLQSPLQSPMPPSPPPTSLSPTLMQNAAMNIPSPTPSPPPPESPEVTCPPDMSPVREPSPVHVDVAFDISETDVALATAPGQDHFDPKNCQFTDEELKPQPMIKKSRKVYVPEERKDNKYWERRRKNNIAAKRSRDARRIKENQIVIRAAYLEKENGALKGDVLDLKKENSMLKKIIATYEKRLNMKMD